MIRFLFIFSCFVHEISAQANTIPAVSSVLMAGMNPPQKPVKPSKPKSQAPSWIKDSFYEFSAWSFANASGTQLMSTLKDENDHPSPHHTFKIKQYMTQAEHALCDSGIVPVRFVKHQKENPSWNRRDTHYQFDKRPGFLFDLKGPPLSAEDVCLLLSPQLYKDFSVTKVTSRHNNRQADKKLLKKIASTVGRPAQAAGHVASWGKNVLWAVEFEREGDKKHSGFFLEPGSAWFDGFEVACKESHCDSLRADGGDAMTPDEWNVIAVVKWRGHEIIFMSWSAPEGQSILGYAIEGNSIFEFKYEDENTSDESFAYRYWAPS